MFFERKIESWVNRSTFRYRQRAYREAKELEDEERIK